MPQPSAFEITNNRFQDGAKLLPVAFVCSIITGLWLIYTFYHLRPREETMAHWEHVSHRAVIFETVSFNVSTTLLWICYLKCILTSPGTIPDKDEDPHWEYLHAPDQARSPDHADTPGLGQETKRSGDRRSCKWCSKYKPDRCHHCRVCRMCILKMDHHCPWIYNCVGFNNHKYFFLLLFYATIDCHIIMWTMSDSLTAALDNPRTTFMTMFLLLFGETLTAFLGLLVTVFFSFHIWLMMKAMTTIEFCEKSSKRIGYDASIYDRGFYGNICTVLGDQPLLWLMPCSPPTGQGLVFVMKESRQNQDAEGRRGREKERNDGGADARGRRQWSSRSPGGRARAGRRIGAGSGSAPGSQIGSDDDSQGAASAKGSLPASPDRSPGRRVGSTPPSSTRDSGQLGTAPVRTQTRPHGVPALSMSSASAAGSAGSPRRPPLPPGGHNGAPSFAGAAAISPKAPPSPLHDIPPAMAKARTIL